MRRTDDPADVSFTADLEPTIVAEFQRRAPTQRTASASSPSTAARSSEPAQSVTDETSSTLRALDAALLASVTDGVLTEAAITMAARMAVAMGLAPNEIAGRAVVSATATRLGLSTRQDGSSGAD